MSALLGGIAGSLYDRLRVVSNFGDSDRGAGENTHTRAKFVSPEFRARVCVFSSAPRSLSPKLETTRSLLYESHIVFIFSAH